MIRASLLCVSLFLSSACGSKSSEPTTRAQPSALPELRAPLAELRAWFDAHQGEARFIAILSPT